MQGGMYEPIPIAAPRTVLSLKNVAEKVIAFFGTHSNSVFDINDVAIQLNVPKRRLYDVLNIMSPLGLVGKNGRGKYLWSGQMQLIFNSFTTKEEPTDKSHVRDLSFKFLTFIRDSDQNTISIGSICGSVFEDKKGQLRRLYDISAVYEVLNLIKRQPKSGDFLVLPLLRGLFMAKMLPPKKRAPLAPIANQLFAPNINKFLVSPPNVPCTYPQGQVWLGSSSFF